MSTQITTAFVQEYKSGVLLKVQQKGSKLRGAVRVESQTGTNAFYDQLGATAAQRRTSRHSDTPRVDTPHSRRRVSIVDYDWADLIDQEDKVRTLNDFTSPYQMNAANAMGRSMDQEIVDAALGTAYTGETGSTTVALPSTQVVVAASTGFTLAKLLNTKEILDGNDVDTDGRYIALTAGQVTDLLNTTEVKNADYNTVKALAAGQINTFMGFTFVPVNGLRADGTKILPVNGASARRCIAWQQSGLLLAVGADITSRITERADKNYATQVFFSMTIGATRMEEEKVVEIVCVE